MYEGTDASTPYAIVMLIHVLASSQITRSSKQPNFFFFNGIYSTISQDGFLDIRENT